MKGNISAKAESKISYVDDDNILGPWDGTKEYPYQNITNALEYAIDGDTVFVYDGAYYENIVVDKSVSLVGENRGLTIIDANSHGNIMNITASNVNITGFTIRRSGTRYYDSGIFMDYSTGNNISHNTIINNYNGISLYSSGNNLILDNTISSNNYNGISLYSSGNNLILDNTISSNNYNGISLYYSSNNVIFHSNFVNNTELTYIYKSINVWDDGVEGNYWSDYTGVDSNYDGIGDIPYIIDESNQDKHPLMGMFSDFAVTLERETYHVTTICNSLISEFRFEVGSETGNKIIHCSVTGKDGAVGFCRVGIPTELMNYPYTILIDLEEITPTLLDISNETCAYLYFTYIRGSHIITIISSKTLLLYNELLDKHAKLQIDLHNLNVTYYALLNNYSIVLGNHSQLQESYRELNNSYQEHLSDYSQSVYNIQNLMYIFAATTAIFLITTIYLSKHAHAGKTKIFEGTKK
jgi:parallel beta-helix repeat protein